MAFWCVKINFSLLLYPRSRTLSLTIVWLLLDRLWRARNEHQINSHENNTFLSPNWFCFCHALKWNKSPWCENKRLGWRFGEILTYYEWWLICENAYVSDQWGIIQLPLLTYWPTNSFVADEFGLQVFSWQVTFSQIDNWWWMLTSRFIVECHKLTYFYKTYAKLLVVRYAVTEINMHI